MNFHRPSQMVGDSVQLRRVLRLVEKVAASEATVLIWGETGTGKEFVADAIHENSGRRAGAYEAVNCAALAETLLESELFGHEKGSFTGAATRLRGRFERAHKGTLFLDEIGDMSAAAQAKILRVLQEREFERVGGTETVTVDVRIIAATKHDLRALVASGRFREDLYYRLAVVRIDVPPLRERLDDIAPLARHFTRCTAEDLHRPVPLLLPETIDRLTAHPWPGNIRELQNVIKRAVLFCEGDLLGPDCVEFDGVPQGGSQVALPEEGLDLRQLQDELLSEALVRTRGNKTKAASLVGITRSQMTYWSRKHQQ